MEAPEVSHLLHMSTYISICETCKFIKAHIYLPEWMTNDYRNPSWRARAEQTDAFAFAAASATFHCHLCMSACHLSTA